MVLIKDNRSAASRVRIILDQIEQDGTRQGDRDGCPGNLLLAGR